MTESRKIAAIVALAISLVLAWGCGRETAAPSPTPPPPTPRPEAADTITLGDISDEPSKKIERFQPLANYLATHLTESGIGEGRVLIAPDMETMAEYLQTSKVDLYFDSPFPTIVVDDLSGAQPILRRWKGGRAEYWTVFIAHEESDAETLEDFVGQRIAFEEPFSTSGYLLPKATLMQKRFKLREYDDFSANVSPDEIGYVFSRDEENTIQWVLHRRVNGAAISNEDYEELPEEIKAELVILDHTVAVPRQLVSARPGLDPELTARLKELLTGLDESEEGREILKKLKDTTQFDEFPQGAEAALAEIRPLIELVREEIPSE